MELSLKEFLTYSSYLSGIVIVWMTASNRISNVEKSVEIIKKIVFAKNGELSIMTINACNEKQKIIDKMGLSIDETKDKLNELSSNILVIMVHMDIDTEKIKRKKDYA